jgi:myo-inositol-1(or 4)-monophosphatase
VTEAQLEDVAIAAAHAGAAVVRRRFAERETLTVEVKASKDYVTEVDRESEAAIVAVLSAETPGIPILAEEGSPAQGLAKSCWIVDPLDGTTNFIHGVPTFAVSVAVQDEAGLAAGAIVDPCRDELFATRRGGGARLNGERIAVSRPGTLQTSLIATGFPFRELSRLPGYLKAFEAFCRSTSGLRRAGAASLDLAYTACGRYDGFFEVGLSPWDVAAGALLVLEAGGLVTDTAGGGAYLGSGSIVAAGPAVHAAMLEVTRSTLG